MFEAVFVYKHLRVDQCFTFATSQQHPSHYYYIINFVFTLFSVFFSLSFFTLVFETNLCDRNSYYYCYYIESILLDYINIKLF